MTRNTKLMNAVRRIMLILTVVATGMAKAQDVQLLVDVPVPSDQLTRLDERCNYIVDNFWKRLNFKSAFSAQERMEATLAQFFSVTPYASADTVFRAIDMLTSGVEKADAKNLVTLAQMAERLCMGDSAEYASEDLMLPFARAVAASKKVKSPEKARYAAMARRLQNSRLGTVPSNFEFTVPDGSKALFSDITEPTVLLFFYEPDCLDCRLARTRLGNDFVVKTLISHNLLKVVAIYPGEPDETWLADIESMPDQWVIGAAPDIDLDFTIKRSPQLYFLDENRKITDKDFSVDAAIMYFSQFMRPQNN